MLSFKQYLIENEHAIDKLKEKYRPFTDNVVNFNDNVHSRMLVTSVNRDGDFHKRILQQHYPNMDKGTSIHELVRIARANNHRPITDHIIDHLRSADPAKDSKHLPHIVNWYANQQFRHEDIGEGNDNPSTVRGVLSRFSDIKNRNYFPNFVHPETNQVVKGTKLDSYRHMTFPQFRSHVHKALGIESKDGSLDISHIPGTQLVHQEPGLTVHQITTREAAEKINAQTGSKWCTGWKQGNQFKNYHELGPLYHVVATSPSPENPGLHQYQFHFASGQLADKNDDMQSVHDLIDKHPQLTNVHAFKQENENHINLPFHNEEERTQIGNKFAKQILNNKPHDKFKFKGLVNMASGHADTDHLKQLYDHFDTQSNGLSTSNRIYGHSMVQPAIHYQTQEVMHVPHHMKNYFLNKNNLVHDWHKLAVDVHHEEYNNIIDNLHDSPDENHDLARYHEHVAKWHDNQINEK